MIALVFSRPAWYTSHKIVQSALMQTGKEKLLKSTSLSVPVLPEVLKALAHEIRWNILALLTHSDYCVAELEHFLDQPKNLVSYHLKKLRELHLVTERRSSADGRDVYYSLDLETVQRHYREAGRALHPVLDQHAFDPGMSVQLGTPVRLLFLCTENSARSQMAEALMRTLSHGQVDVYSAGSHPSSIHPLALRTLQRAGIESQQQYAKHLDVFREQSFDYIVTVCDRMREVCPSFPNDPELIHWSIADPASVEGSEEERRRAFEHVTLQLTARIHALLSLLAYEQTRQQR
jgi:protein-tyrosine-phosphatase/DNA-binding transcriptional ArsR family regulator